MEYKERRKADRVENKSAFQYKIVPVDSSDSPVMHGQLVDYSAAGIRFITEKRLEKNVTLLIQLDPDSLSTEEIDWRQLWETGNEGYLNVIGLVMWCLGSELESGRFEVGTRFIRKALEQLSEETAKGQET